MNLTKLFNAQKELDERIIAEKGLEGQDLLDKKILALLVELGELCNCWRGFKFWSENQEPRTEVVCHACDGQGQFEMGTIEEGVPYFETCLYCEGTGIQARPLLEEYVDCLHFILSIGLTQGFEFKSHNLSAIEGLKQKNVVSQFNRLFDKIGDFSGIRNHNNYMYIVPLFIGLGEMLGFTWEQIEQAYFDKNKINHERQESGY